MSYTNSGQPGTRTIECRNGCGTSLVYSGVEKYVGDKKVKVWSPADENGQPKKGPSGLPLDHSGMCPNRKKWKPKANTPVGKELVAEGKIDQVEQPYYSKYPTTATGNQAGQISARDDIKKGHSENMESDKLTREEIKQLRESINNLTDAINNAGTNVAAGLSELVGGDLSNLKSGTRKDPQLEDEFNQDADTSIDPTDGVTYKPQDFE